MRVHELAKELDVSSKDIIAKLKDLGVEAKSHMSTLDDPAVERIRRELGASRPKKEAAAPQPKPPAPHAQPSAKPQPAAAPKIAHKPPEKPAAPAPVEAVKSKVPEDKVIRMKGPMIVREFAEILGLKVNKLVADLMGMNIFAAINDRLDVNIARKVAEKYGFTVEQIKRDHEAAMPIRKKTEDETEQEDRPEDLMPRPPVVVFLGHVDHGKTSLLDKIRNSSVAKGEHGGITQHIGAYSVDIAGRSITFLDTPGHEAFTAMRARGANLTDIAVIIVAGDDGVMPQTKEAIKHAKAADVAIMVAVNKMDLPTANLERVKQQLQGEGLAPEDWGGEVICAPVSAQTGKGIDHLLEMILLQAEMLELRANPRRRATGYVIEAKMEPGMGPTATFLVNNGTLKIGDAVVCGRFWGRVKALINDRGIKVKSAGPGHPIQCLGLSGVPDAGADFRVMADDKLARSIAESTDEKQRAEQIIQPKRVSLVDLYDHLKETEKKELRLIVKADTQGSVEAIAHALQNIKSAKVSLNILLSSTGNITVNDVMLASASDAVILGFHVSREPGVDIAARHEGVEIRLHQIIYHMLDEVEKAMIGLLMPEYKERIVGHANVKQVFAVGKAGSVAGCQISDGHVTSKSKIRVKRNNEVLFEGTIESLKHFQDHVSEVKEGQECGIRIANFKNPEVGDFLEFYELDEIEQTL